MDKYIKINPDPEIYTGDTKSPIKISKSENNDKKFYRELFAEAQSQTISFNEMAKLFNNL